MTSIEQTGRNVDEATQLALEQLGVDEDAVDVEILEEGAKGFLGLGQAPARVRVTMKESKPAGRRSRSVAAEKKEAPAETAPEEPQQPVAKQETEAVPVTAEQPVPENNEELIRRAAETGREVLQRVLDEVDENARVEIRHVSHNRIVLDMVGGETAVLIGRHGQTINALQYLVGIITNKSIGGGQVRIVLDAEGYRDRREEDLQSQALYLAGKVKESGQEAIFGPLQASERRIVHMALVDDEDVHTYSEGQDPERHVVISPKK